MQISTMVLDPPQQSSDRLRRQNVRTAADVGREDLERVLRVRDVPVNWLVEWARKNGF